MRVDNEDEWDTMRHCHLVNPLLLLPPFGKEDQPGDWGPNRLALHHSLLLSLGEEGNLVVDVLQHDEDGGFAGKLLSSIVLEIEEKLGVVAEKH